MGSERPLRFTIFPIVQFLLFSLKLNAERRLGTPKAPTELAASAVRVGGWAPFMGATGWGAGGQCPGRQARVLLGGLAQWGHL